MARISIFNLATLFSGLLNFAIFFKVGGVVKKMVIKRSGKIKHVKVNTRLCKKTKHRLLMLNYGLVGSCSISVHKNTQPGLVLFSTS